MSQRQQLLAWGIILVVFILLLVLLRGILLPFVAAMAIAYFLDPVADWLERRGLGRTLATLGIITAFFLLATLLILLLVPVVAGQFQNFLDRVPGYVAAFREQVLPYLQSIGSRFGLESQFDVKEALAKNSEKTMEVIGNVLTGLLGGGQAILNLVSLLVVTPIVSFYLLRDWDRMVARVDGYLPREHAATIREQALEIDRVLSGFVRGQMLVCLFLAAFYGAALSIVGLEFGLFIGLLAGAISFIPYVGSTIGLVLSVGVALVQFWPDWPWVAVVLGIFALGQFMEGNFLTPRLVGDRVGLHPVWVIFGLFAGGALFGFVGMLIAVPVFAMIGVLTRFMLGRYRDSRLYSGKGPPAPQP